MSKPSKRTIEVAIMLTKYLPIVAAFIMLIHVALLCGGIDGNWAEHSLVILFAAMLLADDIAFGFCWLHRAFGCYAVFVYWCIAFQKHIGFGAWREPLHWIVAGVGIILFVLLFKNLSQHERCNKQRNKYLD